MAKQIIKAPRGTRDILGEQSLRWRHLEHQLHQISSVFGYSEIRTPMFEQLDLFVRSVGDTSDVVEKEMYEVRAPKGTDRYALKPEGTAGVIRSVIEHGALKGLLPQKFYYLTPCFRHERPQAGRLREFHQYGVELFGADDPLADVEMILLAKQLFAALSLQNITLEINSIGCPSCREDYCRKLRSFFAEKTAQLCPTCHERLAKNPMRLLDCKIPTCQEVEVGVPLLLDALCADCDDHFMQVKTLLTAAEVDFSLNHKIVRGLDYYTKTVFEFTTTDLGAQSAVCGGGRYDGLLEQMGGDPLSGIGFAIGLERVLLLMEAQGVATSQDDPTTLFVAYIGTPAQQCALSIVSAVRGVGFSAELDVMGRTLKAQMKYANKIGAKFVLLLGDTELNAGKAALKRMETGEQQEVSLAAPFGDLLTALHQSQKKDVAL